jgi:cytochrome c-type biogenesis protein CcmH/NrfG
MRSYEVINATKRRKADEDGVWSWWKVRFSFLLNQEVYSSQVQLTVDEQTEMIAETNCKRRKLERERRALERQPSSTYTAVVVFVLFNVPCSLSHSAATN